MHVVHMANAFAGLARCLPFAQLAARVISRNIRLPADFGVRYETVTGHQLWMAGRWLRRHSVADHPTLYYGRRLPAICALGTWGLPATLELHHPPRTAKQYRLVQRFIGSRGFRGLVVISARLKSASWNASRRGGGRCSWRTTASMHGGC